MLAQASPNLHPLLLPPPPPPGPPVCTPYPGEPFTRPGGGPPGAGGAQRDHAALQAALGRLPPVRSLCGASDGLAAVRALPSDCRALLSWLLNNPARVRRFQLTDATSMASHLRSIDPGCTLPPSSAHSHAQGAGGHSHAQAPSFVLRAVPAPGDGSAVAEAGPGPGSGSGFSNGIVAYHGTHLENLHSILHTGLQNLSGTKLQRTGAILGSGIYLSTDFCVAHMFAEPAQGWPLSRFGGRLRVQLVCEVDPAKAGTGIGTGKDG